ncbi:MAG: hypothetical protein DSZ00_02880 [Gammaproteobacteria bacterium]|nr:MAG: hypothetical protein DSZ00_02880 [Gammaproteobacteria bacterium]
MEQWHGDSPSVAVFLDDLFLVLHLLVEFVDGEAAVFVFPGAVERVGRTGPERFQVLLGRFAVGLALRLELRSLFLFGSSPDRVGSLA